VHDQHSRRTATLGFLELVRPAPVIGHCFRAEQIRFGRGSGRIVDEDEQNFSADVHRLEVIPFVFRRSCAVADEYQLAFRGACIGRGARPDDDVIREPKIGVGLA